jgi:hypothetical protein
MIDENLCRNELSPAERASQTARRKEIYEELHPETKHGGDRKSDQVANLSTRSFAEATAAATGSDERTVRRDAERGSKVIGEVIDMITGTKLDTGTYLDKLKRPLDLTCLPDNTGKIRAYGYAVPTAFAGDITPQKQSSIVHAALFAGVYQRIFPVSM